MDLFQIKILNNNYIKIIKNKKMINDCLLNVHMYLLSICT